MNIDSTGKTPANSPTTLATPPATPADGSATHELPLWQRRLPALPLVWFMAAGVLALGLPAMSDVPTGGAAALGAMMVLGGAAVFRRWRRWFWLPVGLGLLTMYAHLVAPWRTYVAALGQDEGYAEVEAVVVDTRLCIVPGFSDPPSGGIDVRIERLRTHDAAPWIECQGLVRLRQAPDARTPTLGERLYVEGAIRHPPGATVPGAFDFRQYLLRQGIVHQLDASVVRPVPAAEATSPRLGDRARAVVTGCRDFFIRRLVRGLPEGPDRAVLAAIMLSYRQGLEPDSRELYLRSGLVHLFSVSGLHVGVVFTCVMLGLMVLRLPMRARHWLAPLLVFGYVLLTGAAPAAMRAWLMLAIWSIGVATGRQSVPVNAVLVAGALLLLDPWNLFETGFHYSFVIVLVLLLAWSWTRRLDQWLHYPHAWRASHLTSRGGRMSRATGNLGRGIGRGAFAMVAAWLGGLALTAWYNQLFLPFGYLVNLGLGLLIWPMFLLSGVKLLVGFLPGAPFEAWLAAGLHLTLEGLRGLATAGSEGGGAWTVARPPWWLVAGWYGTLFAWLAWPGRLRGWVCTSAVLALLLVAIATGWPQAGDRTPITVAIFPGDALPVLLLCPPDHPDRPVLLGVGSRYTSHNILDWLRLQGISELDTVVALDNTTAFAGALPDLLATVPADRVLVLAESSAGMTAYEAAAVDAGARWLPVKTDRPPPDDWRVSKREDRYARDFDLRYRLRPGLWLRLQMRTTEARGTDVTVDYLTDSGAPWQSPASPPGRVVATHATLHVDYADQFRAVALMPDWPATSQ